MKRKITWVAILSLALASAPLLAAAKSPTDRGYEPQKGDAAVGPGMPRLSGGPDDFGYTFTDSTEPDGPTYSFVDISGSGTPIALADDGETVVPIDAGFPFYGANMNNVAATSNGLLDFDGGAATDFGNSCPIGAGGAGDENSIPVYWDDLDPGDDGALLYHESFAVCPVGTGACTIIQWEEFDFFPGDGVPGGSAGTFQAILFDDGTIQNQYEGGAGLDGSSATIAISLDGMGNSLTYSCDSPTISAGLAVEFALGDIGDLAIEKNGDVGILAPYTYEISVDNLGPFDQTGVTVDDMLPAEISYVSDDCGGMIAGQDWSWDIGALANGASATCNLTVELVNNAVCTAVENTATVTGDLIDLADNSSSTNSNGGAEVVDDGGFEAGPFGGTWTESSTNFGTPICDVPGCGTGTGTGPRSGDFWAWFGGIAAFEEGSVSQSVTINPGSDTLTFWVEQIVCADGADFLEVTIDGNQEWITTGADPNCGVLGYRQVDVDISAYADGGTHTLEFHSVIFGTGTTNFFVDDISIPGTPFCVEPQADLELVKEGMGLGNAQGEYHFTVTNLGPGDAFGAEVVDMLPAGVSYVSDDCGGVYDAMTGEWTWAVGDLMVGGDAWCTMLVDILDYDNTYNSAVVSSTGGDVDGSNNSSMSAIGPSVIEVPTLGEIGLGALAGLLLLLALAKLRATRQ